MREDINVILQEFIDNGGQIDQEDISEKFRYIPLNVRQIAEISRILFEAPSISGIFPCGNKYDLEDYLLEHVKGNIKRAHARTEWDNVDTKKYVEQIPFEDKLIELAKVKNNIVPITEIKKTFGVPYLSESMQMFMVNNGIAILTDESILIDDAINKLKDFAKNIKKKLSYEHVYMFLEGYPLTGNQEDSLMERIEDSLGILENADKCDFYRRFYKPDTIKILKKLISKGQKNNGTITEDFFEEVLGEDWNYEYDWEDKDADIKAYIITILKQMNIEIEDTPSILDRLINLIVEQFLDDLTDILDRNDGEVKYTQIIKLISKYSLSKSLIDSVIKTVNENGGHVIFDNVEKKPRGYNYEKTYAFFEAIKASMVDPYAYTQDFSSIYDNLYKI